MRATFMPFSPPSIGEEEIQEVVDTLRSDWITTGPKTKRFEADFAAFLGVPQGVALHSCTAALHVGLCSIGVGPGDAVITTPMTFCATVNVIEYTGATPVMVDVEPDTLNISPTRVSDALLRLTKRRANGRQTSGRSNGNDQKAHGLTAKVMMPVHLFGHPCDMDPLAELAREYNLTVLEDAAHALPAKYKGRVIGAISPLAAFSFYATKNLVTAEGGMLVGDPELLDKARVFGLHGMSRDAWKRYSAQGSWQYDVVAPGFKYNMTDIQASLGLHQLKKLPRFHARRKEIAHRYMAAFSEMAEVQTPTERPEVEHAWHLYPIRLNLDMLTIDRAQFIEELRARNIGTGVHFIPVHTFQYYREKYGYKPEDFPVAYREYLRLISLPLNPRMTNQDVDDVIEAVQDVVRVKRR
jgi:dTDP-4-amino-4,6-dideoxygalactose transaminase